MNADRRRRRRRFATARDNSLVVGSSDLRFAEILTRSRLPDVSVYCRRDALVLGFKIDDSDVDFGLKYKIVKMFNNSIGNAAVHRNSLISHCIMHEKYSSTAALVG